MKIAYYQQYIDAVKELSLAQKNHVLEAIERFILNPKHPLLKNKPFEGKLQWYGSIQVSHHLIMLYRTIWNNQYVFLDCIKI